MEIASVKDELDALVNAPVSGGRDPTSWLPDELIEMIFLMLRFEPGWSRGVECVGACANGTWRRIVRESSLVKRRNQEGKWTAYEAGIINPRVLRERAHYVYALAAGLDGKIYSGSSDNSIRVWSGVDGAHLQTLTHAPQRVPQ